MSKPNEQVSPTPFVTPNISPIFTQTPQTVEQNTIDELENRINSMQQQIDDLQTRLDAVGLPKPSNKNLIPNVPFRIEVNFGAWRSTTWTFRENGQVEIRDGEVEWGVYRLFPNNNTIKLSSEKYDFYGIVLYDNYITAVYENGWIAWAHGYQLTPPRFNTVTQRYELD